MAREYEGPWTNLCRVRVLQTAGWGAATVLALSGLLADLGGMTRGNRSLILLIAVILAGIIVPFVIWGARFDATLSLEGARQWMEGYGSWAWAAGIILLIADIVLPVPSTVVMSALGWKYG